MLHAWVFGSVAITVGYWEQHGVEVDYGARVEIRRVVPDEVPDAAPGVAGIRLLPISEGIWRADLFRNRHGPIHHHHPAFADGDVGMRHLDDTLSADPTGWAIGRLSDVRELLMSVGAADVVDQVPQSMLDPLLPTIRTAIEMSYGPDRDS
jgi:hypothetical protein